MSNAIEKISVAEERMREQWGISAYDYSLRNQHVDLQDLLVVITQQRASAIEAEVEPLKDIITRRNDRLTKEGVVLQKLTELQALYTEDTTTMQISLSGTTNTLSLEEFWGILAEYGHEGGSGSTLKLSKSECEGLVTRCKNAIDEKNNAAQSDMTRLQAVVDRRDESYTTATSLMTSVSDTRAALIKQL